MNFSLGVTCPLSVILYLMKLCMKNMYSLIDEILNEYEGKLVREDVEPLDRVVDLSTLLEADETELAKILRKNVGKKRRKEWPYFPSEKEKGEIRAYLLDELKKRPNISSKLFNALFGIGFHSYFSSWNEFRKEAGLETKEFTKRVFDSVLAGRKKIFEYAIDTIRSEERVTQEKIRKDLHIHCESYNFNSMNEIKYPALKFVVYELLKKNNDLSLRALSDLTGYSRRTIREHVDLKVLKAYAEINMNQSYVITENELKIIYSIHT